MEVFALFASFVLGILEFPKPVSSPSLTGGSHQIAVIAEIPSLRGVSETNDEAISFKIPSKIAVIARKNSKFLRGFRGGSP